MANKNKVFEALSSYGLSVAAIAGIMANIRTESNYNPIAKGDSGTSFGLCQWHKSRWTALKNYCSVQNLDVSTIPAQIEFMLFEMEKSYKSVYQAIRNAGEGATAAGEVAALMCIKYEIPANATASAEKRRSRAITLYNELTAANVPTVHYIVQQGDSISELAERYKISMEEILRFNPEITNPDMIRVGQVIRLPETDSVTQNASITDQIKKGLTEIRGSIDNLLDLLGAV